MKLDVALWRKARLRHAESHGKSSVDVRAIVEGAVLERQLRWTIVTSKVVTILHGQDEALPSVTATEALNIVLPDHKVNLGGGLTNSPDHSHILGQFSNALESGDKVQVDEALGIHTLPKIHVFAQVFNREVVFDLVLENTEDHVVPELRGLLEWNS